MPPPPPPMMMMMMMMMAGLCVTLRQVEKSKCRLLDLEAQQSDDHDTSEGGDSHGLQTQVPSAT
jgi:hypothetical protein